MGNTDDSCHPKNGADNPQEEFSYALLRNTVYNAGPGIFGLLSVLRNLPNSYPPVSPREIRPLPLTSRSLLPTVTPEEGVLILFLGFYDPLELNLMEEECFSSNIKVFIYHF